MVRLYCCKVFSDLMYFEGSKVRLFFELRVIFGDFLNDKQGRLGGIGGLRGLGIGYFYGLGWFNRRLFFVTYSAASARRLSFAYPSLFV